ncbi:Uncharacterised protein [uncultured archaeon]|nr:Uncharacterised protein [uncultured archaeon]
MDSPVSDASFISNPCSSTILASAGTFPPSSRKTMSPGTSSLESIRSFFPSLITSAFVCESLRSSSMLLSAPYSSAVPKMTLSTTTSPMASVSACRSPGGPMR